MVVPSPAISTATANTSRPSCATSQCSQCMAMPRSQGLCARRNCRREARALAGQSAVKADYLPGAESFLDPLREDADRPDSARAVIIPFGLEASVSYGSGTARGPAAILAASHQLELYDDELMREPYLDYGI